VPESVVHDKQLTLRRQDPKYLRPGASRLTAALEGLNASGQDGHIIARSDSSPSARRAGSIGVANEVAPPPQHAADVARLVAHAKRLNKPTAEMVRQLRSLCGTSTPAWPCI
jgi:hypothetical protein